MDKPSRPLRGLRLFRHSRPPAFRMGRPKKSPGPLRGPRQIAGGTNLDRVQNPVHPHPGIPYARYTAKLDVVQPLPLPLVKHMHYHGVNADVPHNEVYTMTDHDDIVNALLDLICERNDLCSDYQLAKHLRRPLSTIRNYRENRTIPAAGFCVQMAEELHEDPLRVIAKVKLETAKTKTERNIWKKYAGRLLLACLAFASAPDQTLADFAQKPVQGLYHFIHYAHNFAQRIGGLGFSRTYQLRAWPVGQALPAY